MKALNRKSLVVLVLSFIFALSMLAFAGTVKPVKADEATPVSVVEEKASIRIGLAGNGGSGLRFRVKLDKATKESIVDNDADDNVKLGFIITPKAIFDKAVEDAEDLSTVDYLTAIPQYVGTYGEGIIADETEGKIYKADDEGNYWYANAVIANIKDKNLDLEFIMVAYVKTAGDPASYQYILPQDTSFARAYMPVVNKAYINNELSLSIIHQAQDERLQIYATEDNPVSVSSAEDLIAISDSVLTATNYYKDAHFKLTENVSVNNDFVKIDSDFAGTFVESENSVKIINGGSALMSIFADEEIDGANVKCTHTLFTVTDESVEERMSTSNANAVVDGFVAKDDIAVEMTELQNPVGYDGNAAKWHTVASKNVSHIYIKPFFTQTELANLTQYNAVTFSFMTSSPEKMHNSNTDDVHSLLSMSHGGQNNTQGILGSMAKYYMTEKQVWRTYTLTKQEVLDAYTNNTTLRINYENNTSSIDIYFYLGNIELVEEPQLFYEKVNAVSSVQKIIPVMNRAEGDTTLPTVGRVSTNTQETAGSVVEKGFISYEKLPAFSNTCPEFLDRKIVKSGALNKNVDVAMYAKLRYTGAEIEKFAGLVVDEEGNAIKVNDKKQYTKYKEIAITYCVEATSAAKFAVKVPGAIKQKTYNTWITEKIDVETFVELMGKTSFKDSDNNVYETSGYSIVESVRDADTGAYTSKVTLTADASYFSRMLFLGFMYSENSTTVIYIADISFVK